MVGIGIALIVVIFASLTVVGAGQRGVVVRLGSVQDRVLDEGMHLKAPFVDSVKKLDVRTRKIETQESAASKDLQIVTTKIALNYHLDPESVNSLWQGIGSEYASRIIDPAIQEAVKASTAKYTAEELITLREEVKNTAKEILSKRLQENFMILDDLSIVDFDFSPSFNKAIEAKVTAEQEALAAKNKLEQVKFEAQQRIEQANAEAEAIRIQADAIRSQGGKEYVNLKAIEAWDGVLPKQLLSDVVPFVNIK